jgi:histone H3/H4
MDEPQAEPDLPQTHGDRGRSGSRPAPMQVKLELPADTVRRIMEQATDRRIEKNAITLVRYFAEEDIRRLAEKADIAAQIRGLKTIQARDVTAARDLLS